MSGKGIAFRIDVILQSVNELREGLLCKIRGFCWVAIGLVQEVSLVGFVSLGRSVSFVLKPTKRNKSTTQEKPLELG